MNYFDPFAPRSSGRYYPGMPFSPFIYPTGTEPEKDHWLQARAEDILPARDYTNGEVFNVGQPDVSLPSLEVRTGSLGQAIGAPGTWVPVAIIAGAAALAFLFLKKK